ncbi:MAG TPA: PspC domain-containing protein [Thermodesulfobacteriota bacterium]
MKKIYRSKKDKMIAGICGGLGEMFEIDPTLIRLGLVFIGLVTGIVPLVIAYILGWIIIPENPE